MIRNYYNGVTLKNGGKIRRLNNMLMCFMRSNEEFKVLSIGAIDNNYAYTKEVSEKSVDVAADALLAGKEVKQKTTAAIGCGIKTKK